ncbi:MAG: DUF2231 domain-containing protein [Elusimicrobiota bacterium]
MNEIPLIDLHMAAAHFPIALLITGFFFEISGAFFRKDDLRTTAYWMHLSGILCGFVTISLGFLGNPFREDTGFIGKLFVDYGTPMANKMVIHQWVGVSSITLFVLLGFWRVFKKNDFKRAEYPVFLFLLLLGVVFIGATGYLGHEVME